MRTAPGEERYEVTILSFRDLLAARQSAYFLADAFRTHTWRSLLEDFRHLPLQLASGIPEAAAEILRRHLLQRGAEVLVELCEPLPELSDALEDIPDDVLEDDAIISEGREADTYDELLVAAEALVLPVREDPTTPVSLEPPPRRETHYAVSRPGFRDRIGGR